MKHPKTYTMISVKELRAKFQSKLSPEKALTLYKEKYPNFTVELGK